MVLVAKPKRRPTVHNKRRVGSHHRHDPHYIKTYWPYLPMVVIVAAGLAFSSVLSGLHKDVLGYATDMSVSTLLSDTNTQREQNSLGDLTLNQQLDNAAQAKANDMATRDYWSHNTPDGKTPWTFIIASGYSYQTAGENLAYGFDSSDATVTAWMNSPEHRANILNATYKDVGFGVANSPNYQNSGPQTIVVAMYASPQPVASAPAPTAPASKPAAQSPSDDTPVANPETSDTPPATPTDSTPIAAATPSASPVNSTTSGVKPATSVKPLETKDISRVQLVSGTTSSWSVFAVSTAATVALAAFVLRHWLFVHRTFIKGEKFVLKHRMLDLALVTIMVMGYVLTRTAGFIR
ncbi:MAG TPA: CAP domain-containing protein [Patescibacteria group bacterium]|nr:CAP domain-containing protein [Patescibacteria group bacterium]